MHRLYSLQFFAGGADNGIIQIDIPDNTNASETFTGMEDAQLLWQPLIKRIRRIVKESTRISKNDPAANVEPIQILFVQTQHLTSKSFLDNLSGTEEYISACIGTSSVALRQTKPPTGPAKKEAIDDFRLYPVITIGYPDITRIYEDSPNLDFETEEWTKYWQTERKDEKNAWLYHLNFDRRIKFLDSSIWHRYVAYDEDFENNFEKILQMVIACYDLRLYQSLAGLATLEFECRMLQNASIAQYGTHGHHEAVTPFEFHSETAMERKAEKFMAFFEKERQGVRLADLKWQVLLVDDYANQPISTVDDSAREDKRYLIQRWINNLDAPGTYPEQKSKRLNVEIVAYTSENNRVIGQAVEFLKEQTFDIILLDYLLGDSELQKGLNTNDLKAYGHEFLLELTTHRDRAKFRHGPFGRYWILPISSFPFAFTEKLKQLNLDGSSERWYIASGGDPITTPALFRLNFYRLLLRQISECYLHQAAFVRQIDRYNTITNKSQWCDAIKHRIDAELQNRDLLAGDRDGSSSFAESMEYFLSYQKDYEQFWASLRDWIVWFQSYQKGQSAKKYFDDLQGTLKKYPEYGQVCEHILAQAELMIFDAEAEIIKYAKNNSQVIKFTDSYLHRLSKDFFEIIPNVEEINVSHNRITNVAPEVHICTQLKYLDLSDNTDLSEIPVEALLSLLKESLCRLNLKNTKIANDLLKNKSPEEKLKSKWPDFITTNAHDTKEMLEYIKDDLDRKALALKAKAGKANPYKTVNIFISCTYNDSFYKDQLFLYLNDLKRRNVANIQSSIDLPYGKNIQEIIKKDISKADIIIILLSVFLINSEQFHQFEYEEIERRNLHKGVTVIPVYLTKVDIDELFFVDFVYLPKPVNGELVSIDQLQNLNDAFYHVAKEIKEVVASKKLLLASIPS